MKVCVFGASGYVGASLYQQLKEKSGIDVVGTYLETQEPFNDLYKLDVNQPESFSEFYKQTKPDVVIWSVMDGPNEHQLTDQGLMHLITHLTAQTKLIYISSDFVYADGDGPYDEEDPTSKLPEDNAISNYTNGKIKAENFIERELTNYAILRAGPTYGENKIGKLDERTDKLATHLKTGSSIAFRDDLIRTFVHIDDLTHAVIQFVENDKKGIYNTGPDKAQSFYEFMQEAAEEMGFDKSLVEKNSEDEEINKEMPKNTSLKTDKIKEELNLRFR